MAILQILKKFRQNPEPIKDSIIKIKNGDSLLKEKIINEYKPFIINVVSKTTGKFVDTDNSDEYSIGLIAFNEAIECFDESKNAGFLNFAETVIKRRVIDYLRSNEKNNKTYPFTYFEKDDIEEDNIFEEKYLKDEASNYFENIETKEEIEIFKQKLKSFGVTLEDLVENSPKHIDSKRLSIKIARTLLDSKDLSEKLEKKKRIPMVDLMKIVGVNSKTVERNRKFIIAVYLILNSKLDVMMSYIENIEKEG